MKKENQPGKQKLEKVKSLPTREKKPDNLKQRKGRHIITGKEQDAENRRISTEAWHTVGQNPLNNRQKTGETNHRASYVTVQKSKRIPFSTSDERNSSRYD